MCGLLGHKIDTKTDNSRISLRGQDFCNTFQYNNFIFNHSLLSVTGEFTTQPFIDGDIVCVYNGEIYNHKFAKSDGEVLIPLYKEYGTDFPKYLDGEFAIVLFDFKKDLVIFATDPFKTKPLFIKGIEFASYRSGLGGRKARPNEILVKRISDGKVIERKSVYNWDLTQYKDNYEDWLIAFQEAIRKRAKNGCFLGLSSGYDSGAIACELLKQNIDFKSYIFNGSENKEVLDKRKELVNYELFEPDYSLISWLHKNIDNEKYTIKYKSGLKLNLFKDGGYLGVATIAKLANKDGRKVCLSGQGADEIMSDYSKFPDQSELLGVYPDELKLWDNFNYGCQESYLIKEEYAGGAFNIETRYPYLDKQVVQEFLWLKPELKNKYYKAPLREYLVRNNFPFDEDKKIGFGIQL